MSLINIQSGSGTIQATISGEESNSYTVNLGEQSVNGLSNGETVSFKELESGTDYVMELIVESPLVKTILISKNDSTALSLSELRVYNVAGINIARAGTASQSSTAFGAIASNAINGSPWGKYTHTNSDGYKWWKLVLEEEIEVSRVNVYNRSDCCQFRLNGAVLYLIGTAGNIIDSRTLSGNQTQFIYF